jgi:hypothetical protein
VHILPEEFVAPAADFELRLRVADDGLGGCEGNAEEQREAVAKKRDSAKRDIWVSVRHEAD